MSAKNLPVIIGIVLVFVAGIAIVLFAGSGAGTSNQSAQLLNALSQDDWIRGNANASVTLIEYGDFQCPACGSYYPLVEKILSEFGEKIKFSYRHFPLSQIHSHADLAAHAAEAAGKQGKFWEMSGQLFDNQRQWAGVSNAEDIMREYAVKLGLNAEQWKKDLDSDETAQEIKKDYEGGIKSGVNATPTFFLNGKKMENPREYEEFRQIIIREIGQR